MIEYIGAGLFLTGLIFLVGGIRIIRPTHRGAIETFGKYSKLAIPGFNWICPLAQRLIPVDITEQMAIVNPQEIITEDKLNATVDLVVYYKVDESEKGVKASLYNVYNFQSQIITLAQTTARNVIGKMSFKDVNSERNELNNTLADIMSKETATWGVKIVRVEIKEITPPKDVQNQMNQVNINEQKKRAAIDLATARETEADGIRRASIKEAEGERQAKILRADGDKQAKILEAEGLAKYNELITKSFKSKEVQLFKKLETVQTSLKDNSKIILTEKGINTNIILGDIPIKEKK